MLRTTKSIKHFYIIFFCLILLFISIAIVLFMSSSLPAVLLNEKKDETTHKQQDIKTNAVVPSPYNIVSQGFQLTLPAIGKWNHMIKIDEKNASGHISYFDATYHISEKENNISFNVRTNLFGEVTPLLPQWPFCLSEKEMLFFNNKVPLKIYSAYDAKSKAVEDKCTPFLDNFLLSEHSVGTRFCLNKTLKTYPAKLETNGEYHYSCEGGDNLYYFELYCDGTQWEGKNGRDGCYRLFNKILSSFKLI